MPESAPSVAASAPPHLDRAAPDDRVGGAILAAVAIVAFATLALQVLVARLLAALVYYHFSFLAISLALLGTGAGGMWVSLHPPAAGASARRRYLAGWCGVFAVTLAALPVVVVRLNLDYSNGLGARFVVSLAVACLMVAIPAFAGGVAIAGAIASYPSSVNRIYAVDLLAAGLGAFTVVPALWLVNPPHLLELLGVLAAMAALLCAVDGRGRQLAVAAGGVPLLVLVLGVFTGVLTAPLTGLSTANADRAEQWTPLSRVIGVAPHQAGALGVVIYDRVTAPIVPYRRTDPSPDWQKLLLGPQTIPTDVAPKGKALIIGGGGGRDIHNLRAAGVSDIDVIELNEGIRKVVDEDLATFSGSPYSLPGVHTVIGDGRSILARRARQYSQIQISFTDSLSAGGAAAYALSENNLYTVEAFDEYLDKLVPGGILAVTRRHQLVGDEALRATVLALETMRRRGVAHPEQHVVVVLGRELFNTLFGTVLVKNEPFTAAELDRIKTLADTRGEGVAFAPGGPYQLEWADLAKASSPSSFCHHYRLNVCAPTDDQPFFFNMKRLSDVGRRMTGYSYDVDPVLILFLTFAILVLLSIFGYALPMARLGPSNRPGAGALSYFVAIGLGYLMVESVLVQRLVLLLGYPTYSLSVVLTALLAFTGVGSWLSGRFRNERTALQGALAIATILIALSAFAVPALARAWIDQPFPLRVTLTVALLAPFGLSMGMAMPIGLRRLAASDPQGTPYAWAVNGFASVVAAALATVLALLVGFTVTTLVGAAAYLAAFLHARFGAWTAADQA